MLGVTKFIHTYSLVNDTYEQTHILNTGSYIQRFYLSSNVIVVPLINGMVKVYNNSDYNVIQTIVSGTDRIQVATSSKD